MMFDNVRNKVITCDISDDTDINDRKLVRQLFLDSCKYEDYCYYTYEAFMKFVIIKNDQVVKVYDH